MADHPSVANAEADWVAALHGDRAAFQRVIEPYLGRLLEAAVRDLRYHSALGDFGGDPPTAEELVGDVLIRAWRDRKRRPPNLGMRAWLIGLLFRVTEDFVRREARFHRAIAASLDEEAPSEPHYNDDEGFWEWYRPEEGDRLEDLVGDPMDTPEQMAIADDDFAHALPPRLRQTLLLHDVHGVPLRETAKVLGLSVEEAQRLLGEARRRLGKTLTEQPS